MNKKNMLSCLERVFVGKFGVFVLLSVAVGVFTLCLTYQGCIAKKSYRFAVLAEIQNARNRLDNVLACDQQNWHVTCNVELKYKDRLPEIFAGNDALVRELHGLYDSLGVGISNAKELRQALLSKETIPKKNLQNLKNSIRAVVAEADCVGPKLAEEIGGTWQEQSKNLTSKERANNYLHEIKEATGSSIIVKQKISK
ncbi:MAG: hypothetical protein FD156_1821 [Nitrospirae bacterium]|nr:MAG: hypothetical protein FD156_1821 [Nitrospirota bacterium]